MRVLVACEYSGIVRDAFAARGHNAMSCDLLPTDAPHGLHYQGDIFDLLQGDLSWDLMVAHPPCTRLTIAGAAYLYRPDAVRDREEAIEFFARLQAAPIPKIAIENPTPFKLVTERVGKYTQRTNPFMFGDPVRKAICLWLKNLPVLVPTNIVPVEPTGYCIRKTGPRAGERYNYYHHQGKNAHERSRFFPGIAAAMAAQWG